MAVLTVSGKLAVIFMLSASAFCVWSVAWMVATSYRMIRDSMSDT